MATQNPNYSVIIQQAADAGLKGPKSVTVVASLPATFAFDINAEYQAPFAQGILGGGGALSSIAKLGGLRLTTQALTAQIWQGSTENELSLDLEFQSETDPDLDVRQPILKLIKMTAASVDPSTGMLKSPGPQINIDATGQIASDAGSSLKNSLSTVGNAFGGSGSGGAVQGSLNSQDSSTNGKNNTNTAPVTNGGLGGADYWKNIIRNQISIKIGRYAFFDSVVITNVQKTYENQIDTDTGLATYARVNLRFKPLFLLLQSDIEQIFALQKK
jgi:hypothetical protein